MPKALIVVLLLANMCYGSVDKPARQPLDLPHRRAVFNYFALFIAQRKENGSDPSIRELMNACVTTVLAVQQHYSESLREQRSRIYDLERKAHMLEAIYKHRKLWDHRIYMLCAYLTWDKLAEQIVEEEYTRNLPGDNSVPAMVGAKSAPAIRSEKRIIKELGPKPKWPFPKLYFMWDIIRELDTKDERIHR